MVFTSLTKPLLSLFHTRTVVILQNYKNPFNVDSVLIIIIVVSVSPLPYDKTITLTSGGIILSCF